MCFLPSVTALCGDAVALAANGALEVGGGNVFDGAGVLVSARRRGGLGGSEVRQQLVRLQGPGGWRRAAMGPPRGVGAVCGEGVKVVGEIEVFGRLFRDCWGVFPSEEEGFGGVGGREGL